MTSDEKFNDPEFIRWKRDNASRIPEGVTDEKNHQIFRLERLRVKPKAPEGSMSEDDRAGLERAREAGGLDKEGEALYQSELKFDEEKQKEIRAIQALQEPFPIERFYTAFRYSHVGHEQILRAIVYAEVLKSSTTTKGLQPTVTGKRGAGKSHAVRTAVHLLPKDAVYTATLSPKALFYKNPAPKTTFYLDDVVLLDEMTSFLKRKMTQFQEFTTHGIVDNKQWCEKIVSPRMVFILTSVGVAGDEQLSDRALAIDIKNEKIDDEAYYQFESTRRTTGMPEFPENPDVTLCRDMLSHIRKNEYRVVMPDVDFSYYSDRRLIGQFYDLMEGSAILNYLNRRREIDENKTIVVWADERDLAAALDFDMFKYSDAEADDRLLKSERGFDNIVQNILSDRKWLSHDWTEKQLAEATGTNPSTLKKYLYGCGNTASSVSEGQGLCGKTKWYNVDTQKDTTTESVKNFITVKHHEYSGLGKPYAWIKTQESDDRSHTRIPPT